MTKNDHWPGWRAVRKQRLQQLEESQEGKDILRRHSWQLLNELQPPDESYQQALATIIGLDGHPSAKERLR